MHMRLARAAQHAYAYASFYPQSGARDRVMSRVIYAVSIKREMAGILRSKLFTLKHVRRKP